MLFCECDENTAEEADIDESFLLYESDKNMSQETESSMTSDLNLSQDDDDYQYNQFDESFDGYQSEEDDSDDESFFSYCSTNESVEISGRRIVDLKHVLGEIQTMNSHSSSCNFNDMNLVKEVRRGLLNRLRFVCSKCFYIHVLETCVKQEDTFSLNYECVLGAMNIGIGFSQLQLFTGILDVPMLNEKSYRTIERTVQVDVIRAAEESMKSVAEDEKSETWMRMVKRR